MNNSFGSPNHEHTTASMFRGVKGPLNSFRSSYVCKIFLLTLITGLVRRPQAKNSRKMTTRAWNVLACPNPEDCNKYQTHAYNPYITEQRLKK